MDQGVQRREQDAEEQQADDDAHSRRLALTDPHPRRLALNSAIQAAPRSPSQIGASRK
jgi:hypothetical protein